MPEGRFRLPRPGSRAGGTVARVPILIAVIAALVIGGLVDRTGGTETSATQLVRPVTGAAASVASAAAPDALSSSWFCGGATDDPKGSAPGELVVTNAGAGPLGGTVTLIPSRGPRVISAVRVKARSAVVVGEVTKAHAAWVGAFVELEGGQALVEQRLSGALGSSSTPCATTASRTWYFPAGATLVNARTYITLLNPYPLAAIADLSFVTNQGVEQVNDFGGLVVAARGMLVVDLGTHLRRRRQIATTVSVRSGALVAWKTDVVTPPDPREATIGSAVTPGAAGAADPAAAIGGVSDVLGAPAPATTMTWPQGDSGNGVDERYVVYNPGSSTAKVQLRIGLDAGIAEPFSLSVGPESVASIISSGQARIPAGLGHLAVLQSVNGVPVVAERTVAAGPPSPLSGLGELMGIPVTSRRWLVGPGIVSVVASGVEQESLVIVDPGDAAAVLSVDSLDGGPLPGLAAIHVAARSRVSVPLPAGGTGGAAIVTGSQPLVVERDLYGPVNAPGVSLSAGVPLPD